MTAGRDKAGEKCYLCNFEYEISTSVRDFKNSHFCKAGRRRNEGLSLNKKTIADCRSSIPSCKTAGKNN